MVAIDFGSVPDWVGIAFAWLGLFVGGAGGVVRGHRQRMHLEDRRALLHELNRLRYLHRRVVQREPSDHTRESLSRAWVAILQVVPLLPFHDRALWALVERQTPSVLADRFDVELAWLVATSQAAAPAVAVTQAQMVNTVDAWRAAAAAFDRHLRRRIRPRLFDRFRNLVDLTRVLRAGIRPGQV